MRGGDVGGGPGGGGDGGGAGGGDGPGLRVKKSPFYEIVPRIT